MTIVVYPDIGYNSFVTETESDTIIGGFTSDNGYLSLTLAEKQALLVQAFTEIRTCSGFSMPDIAEDDLKVAQCYMAANAVGSDMFAYDANSSAVNKEKVDTLEVGYDTSLTVGAGSVDAMLPIVQSLLSPFGCSKSSNFRNVYIGRG